MQYEPDRELLVVLAEAHNAMDLATRRLIVAELESMIPEYQQREQDAATRLQDAVAAMAPGEQELASLDAEISRAGGESGTWREQLNSGEVGDRVSARLWLEEWQAELNALTAKRDQLVADQGTLRQALARAKMALDEATTDREALEFNCRPELAYTLYGRQTAAYQSFRWGINLAAAMKRDHPEYDEAIAHMDFLAESTGYRTTHLPQESDKYRDMWDEIFAQANLPEAVPSGQQVISEIHRQGESMALRKAGDRVSQRVDDYRGSQPPKVRDYVNALRHSVGG